MTITFEDEGDGIRWLATDDEGRQWCGVADSEAEARADAERAMANVAEPE